MKVKQLIELLRSMPQEADVRVEGSDGEYGAGDVQRVWLPGDYYYQSFDDGAIEKVDAVVISCSDLDAQVARIRADYDR